LLVGKGGSDVSINVNVDVDVDDDVTPEPVAPTLSAASSRPRVFQPVFSSTGLVVAAFFFALSLLPSLLPRAGYAQGVISGVTLMIGYGIGAGSQSLWDYLGIPKLTGRTRTILPCSLPGAKWAGRTRSVRCSVYRRCRGPCGP
jgi:uncharacterized membrane protein